MRFPSEIYGPEHPITPLAGQLAPSFDPEIFLAQYLDLLAVNLPDQVSFAADLRHSPKTSLKGLLENLSPKSRKSLEGAIGSTKLKEIAALSEERDPELFWAETLRLAHRLESEDKVAPAQVLLAAIASANTVLPEAREQADKALKAIRGEGEVGARAEYLLSRFSREVMDPWMVAGFGLGSVAYRTAKLGTLSRLWSASAGRFVTGPLAAELIASGVGLGLEAPAFLFTSKLGHQLSGIPQDWGRETLFQELAGASIGLFSIKSVGHASRSLAKFAQGSGKGSVANFSQAALPQTGMFAGIVLARRVEEKLGLRSPVNDATLLTDSLVTFLQFSVGGKLAERALGSGFKTLQGEADARLAMLKAARRASGPFLGIPSLATAESGPRSWRQPSILEQMNAPLMMSENQGDGGKGSPRRLHLVKTGPSTPAEGSKDSQSGATQEPDPTPPKGVLDISRARVLRSRPMDEKEKQFRAEVDSVMLGSASEIRRRALDQEVIAKLPASRRQELTQNLQGLHPEVVDLFGSAARDLPWQAIAQAFVEMKLMRSSPEELKAPPNLAEPSQYSREVLAEELRLDHQRLFGKALPGAPAELNGVMGGLSAASIRLLGHWAQNPGTRLLMGQRLGLPGIPSESEILQAYRKWWDRPPDSQ